MTLEDSFKMALEGKINFLSCPHARNCSINKKYLEFHKAFSFLLENHDSSWDEPLGNEIIYQAAVGKYSCSPMVLEGESECFCLKFINSAFEVWKIHSKSDNVSESSSKPETIPIHPDLLPPIPSLPPIEYRPRNIYVNPSTGQCMPGHLFGDP